MDLCQHSDVLLFNMLSRFVIAFLPRTKCLLISWLQSLSTVILEPKKIKSVTVTIFPPSICHEVMGSYLGSPTLHADSLQVQVVKNPLVNVGDMRCGFDPWIGKIPWRRVDSLLLFKSYCFLTRNTFLFQLLLAVVNSHSEENPGYLLCLSLFFRT